MATFSRAGGQARLPHPAGVPQHRRGGPGHKARSAAFAGVLALAGVPVWGALAQPPVTQINQGQLISALNNVNVQVDRVNALNNLTLSDIRVVNVQDVIHNSSVLNNALRDANIQVLQDFLNGSLNNNVVQVLNNALNNNNVNVSRVVAVDVLSGGDVILFNQ